MSTFSWHNINQALRAGHSFAALAKKGYSAYKWYKKPPRRYYGGHGLTTRQLGWNYKYKYNRRVRPTSYRRITKRRRYRRRGLHPGYRRPIGGPRWERKRKYDRHLNPITGQYEYGTYVGHWIGSGSRYYPPGRAYHHRVKYNEADGTQTLTWVRHGEKPRKFPHHKGHRVYRGQNKWWI